MANICNNEFYASSENSENIKIISDYISKNFNCYLEENDGSIEGWFESRWDFPYNSMVEMFNLLPDKNNIYMRCLSVEYGCDYVDYWKCTDETGWYSKF